jgi:hypothetical protein
MIKGFPYKQYKRLIRQMQGEGSEYCNGKVYEDLRCIVKSAKEEDATKVDPVRE